MTTPPNKKPVADDADHQQEQPQRSRNARAQARHRAKRKAYIEQLEETVTKLQAALNLSPEQVAALPTAQVRIRELEQDNMRLRSEINSLRMQLDPYNRGRRDPMPLGVDDPSAGDRDKKRRRLSGEMEGVYLTPGGTPTHVNNPLSRPPPLSLPHPSQHHHNHHQQQHNPHHQPYSAGGGNNNNNGNGISGLGSSNSLFPIHAPPFQGPGTPTASTSAASTPSYSASSNPLPPIDTSSNNSSSRKRASSLDPPPPLQHHHQHHSQHQQGHGGPGSQGSGGPGGAGQHHMHLPLPVSSHYNHVLPPPFSQSTPHYEVVPKAEDDYTNSNHDSPSTAGNNGTFPSSMHSFGSSDHESSSWHVYSAERAQLHHQ